MKINKILIIFTILFVLSIFSTQTIFAFENQTSADVGELKEIENSDEQDINVNIEVLNEKAPYQVGTYSFKVTDNNTGESVANKNITTRYRIAGYFDITQNQVITTDSNGVAKFYLNKISNPNTESKNLPVGTFNLTFTDTGNIKTNFTTPLTIEKADVTITPTVYKEDKGSLKNFTFKVCGKDSDEGIKSAVLTLYIPNTENLYYKVITNDKGIGEIAVSGLNIGEYPVTISTNDTNLNSASADSKITINKISVKISVESLVNYFNSGNTAVIKVTDSKTSKAISGVQVEIKVDGVKYYYKSDKNGKITFKTSLGVGKHSISFNAVGNTYSSNNVLKTLNIKKATGKFSASSKTYYYKSGNYMIVKLVNTKNKKGIFNAKIHFQFKRSKKVISNFYGTTQGDGKIKFNLDLKPGTYNIVISGDDSKNFNAKKLTAKMIVKKSPLKLTTKTSKKQLQIKVINKKSNKVVNGVKLKVKVYTGKSFKVFTAKSNSKGLLNVNLKSIKNGSHKIEITTSNSYYTLKTFKKTIKIKE